MNHFHRNKSRRDELGQVLPLFAVFLPIIIVLVGFGIDIGLVYVTNANLSKAVDAACLTGMRNLYQGQPQAAAIARSSFALNYGSSGRDSSPPVVNVNFTTDASNNTRLAVNATATVNTFFIRVLPGWKTMNVSARAQATRANVIMSLVLDRSGSMNGNGGAAALPPAVGTFIDLFDDNLDRVAMTSFSSDARVDVAMRTNFKTPIKNAANSMVFQGGTFAQGGLANAQIQNNSVAVAPGENVVKVAVFFTDGLANIVQSTLNCGGAPTLRNFGGYDAGSTVGFFDPRNGTQLCTTSGGTPSCCSGVNRFRAAIDGSLDPFSRQFVTPDAEFRAVQTANNMRAQGMLVYSIGLGNGINRAFLQQVANDPASATFDPNQPVGQAVFAPTAAELQEVFQTIASRILLRLTQ